MRILIIGKYPPIQGGVSARTYWLAHDLANAGHEIHVITNAKDVEKPYRIDMLDEDWKRCEKTYSHGGSVTVHWTNSDLEKQYHIPWHNPFITKLVSRAIEVIEQYNIDLIFSYYLEPYGVAGYLVSKITNKPHIIKHAGSDIGRLWKQQDFTKLYAHILSNAHVVISGKLLENVLMEAGVKKTNIAFGLATKLSSVFNPSPTEYPDWLPRLSSDTRIIGIYGKLGLRKGTFDLLKAISKLDLSRYKLHLIVVGHGENDIQEQFDNGIKQLHLNGIVTQLPFIPNWRIPIFIKSCDAICFLEQNFPISFHAPTVAQEVLACGKLLICSTEILGKQAESEKLIHGYNCLAIQDVSNHEELANKIRLLFTCEKDDLTKIGQRGYEYYSELSKKIDYPNNIINVFESVLLNKFTPNVAYQSTEKTRNIDLLWTKKIIEQHKDQFKNTRTDFFNKPILSINHILSHFIQHNNEPYLKISHELLLLEKQILSTLHKKYPIKNNKIVHDSLFRLGNETINQLQHCIESSRLKLNKLILIRKYEYDANQMLRFRSFSKLPDKLNNTITYVLTYPNLAADGINILVLNHKTFLLLKRFDGKKPINDVIQSNDEKKLILNFIQLGILSAS